MIKSGSVRVDGMVVRKPSNSTRSDAVVEVAQGQAPVVGRGAHKLAQALDTFNIEVKGRRALDAGASTGGFTQVLLDRGVASVVAADVGHGQLAAHLASDPRVRNEEGVNLRYLDPSWGWGEIDLVTADLSFISLTLVLPGLVSVLADEANLVLLVKPQFEAGRQALDSRGVVRSTAHHAAAVRRVVDAASELGLHCANLVPCSVRGTHGNQEYLLHAVAGGQRPARTVSVEWIARVVIQDGASGIGEHEHRSAGTAKRM